MNEKLETLALTALKLQAQLLAQLTESGQIAPLCALLHEEDAAFGRDTGERGERQHKPSE
jgi:hypothetical protein